HDAVWNGVSIDAELNILDQERFLGLRHRTNLHSFGAAGLGNEFYKSLIPQNLCPRFEQVFFLGVAAAPPRPTTPQRGGC
ncbi:MAG: hypothetical protein IJQ35_03485, partial [Bacteroidales bacterium]|nr:hypothetical protein [Bacteroidales bacterium]